tara:strand:- start:31968 stop:32939 length:972 start_codon:yes stop_codon:yes gene_type:complete
MLIEDQHPHNKSIMVAALGAPNVGKSSMINYLLGTDLTVVTHKPQTTRNHIHCVMTVDHTEIVLVDTPGMHKSNQEFNKRLNQQAVEGAEGADINLLLVDITRPVLEQINDFKENFNRPLARTWLLFTKGDAVQDSEKLPLAEITEKAKEIIPAIEKHFLISSRSELNMNNLIGALCDEAKSGPHLYGGAVSNKNERFFATEYIREQAFTLLKDEIPYEVAVLIEEFRDMHDPRIREKRVASKISASIIVNRPSQRAIVIGSGGQMIKEIGVRSRERIEQMMGNQVHLNLHVKVAPKWFKNNMILEQLGLPRAEASARVWRQK